MTVFAYPAKTPVRCETGDFLAGSNQYLRGAGFYARGIGDVTAVSVLHLLSIVAVIDGRTGKAIATRVLTPTLKVAPDLSRAKFDKLGEQRITEVRTKLVDLPKNSWEPTFKALFTNN